MTDRRASGRGRPQAKAAPSAAKGPGANARSDRRAPPVLTIGDRLMAENHRVRSRVIEVLDELSAPMTARQLEEALLVAGLFTRLERRKIVKALKVLPIIAVGAG